jgi:hypothetical protein
MYSINTKNAKDVNCIVKLISVEPNKMLILLAKKVGIKRIINIIGPYGNASALPPEVSHNVHGSQGWLIPSSRKGTNNLF